MDKAAEVWGDGHTEERPTLWPVAPGHVPCMHPHALAHAGKHTHTHTTTLRTTHTALASWGARCRPPLITPLPPARARTFEERPPLTPSREQEKNEAASPKLMHVAEPEPGRHGGGWGRVRTGERR